MTTDSDYPYFPREFSCRDAVLEERSKCIRAICTLCNSDIPVIESAGRVVHKDGDTLIRCPANPIYALDEGTIPRIFLKVPELEK